jgi:hypothetical protein
VVAVAKMRFQPVAVVKPHEGVARDYSFTIASHQSTDEELAVTLAGVPEVYLEDRSMKAASAREAAKELHALAWDMQTKNKETDGYIRYLKKKRGDLAGLPFLLGKECQAEKTSAKALAAHATLIRESLTVTDKVKSRPGSFAEYARPQDFWNVYRSFGRHDKLDGRIREADAEREKYGELSTAVPALRQMLATEEPGMRTPLVEQIRASRSRAATRLLAQYVVFDPDIQVRSAALTSLQGRPQTDYDDLLLTALRHPWAPVAQRAAQALMFLRLEGVAPRLVDLLDSPDPRLPTVEHIGDAKVYEVKELVRINHHRNCLLCHPSVDRDTVDRIDARSVALGAVPVPGEAFPKSTGYGSFRSKVVVRADITYLRQDFSMLLPVADHGKWPEQQRFDFLVRTRHITREEAAHWPDGPNLHRQYVLQVLQALLRKDLGPETQAWRDEIARIEPNPGRFGNRPCVR